MYKPTSPTLDDDVCVHIFSVSATMVGVCLTVIGIIRVVITLRQENLIFDDLVAVNLLFYLVAAFSSYWSLRTHRMRRGRRMLHVADTAFLIALVFTAINAAGITWMMSAYPGH
ncbi:hypothetical protein [Pseudomonas sp. PDM22]|uniref:hypothetical protein n=1 Tax=Pseudomonas sp. PDM22 TaxID=2769287 RepID=UPI0009DAAF92|nr:hypothetical protein [Pseudomonas sp. PDM22]MBD9516130.1 hypothetical protein [Pseudomonas sp. PDM22]OQR32911.1 hypothetical protein BWR15_15775 [Pseudomonas sp. T]